jgi:hypothetical protein
VSKQVESERMGKFVKVLLVANLCVWIYFWIAFAQASYPFRPDPFRATQQRTWRSSPDGWRNNRDNAH